MDSPRKHGKPPYSVAVLHGGPGAAGEMAPVARQLATERGILEPWQTATTLDGQIEELASLLRDDAELPVILVGFSWGAWLGFLLAARHPALVRKLILVGSGPFATGYAAGIGETRLSRLPEEERVEARSLLERLEDRRAEAAAPELSRLGELFAKADAFDPVPSRPEAIDCRPEIHQPVWAAATELRHSGELLGYGRKIRCPVVAIHGDFDPHPSEGVRIPLQAVLEDFRWILLENCGHRPWIERRARQTFFRILAEELG